jgi:acyl carrier protein
MNDIITKSIIELNNVLPKEKRLVIKNSTPLIDEKSRLESIDLVNLFVILEKNLKEKDSFALTFDEIVENTEYLKTIGSLESFLVKKLKNEKK